MALAGCRVQNELASMSFSMGRALCATTLLFFTVQRWSIADARQLVATKSSSVKCSGGTTVILVQDGDMDGISSSSTVLREPCKDETDSASESSHDLVFVSVAEARSQGETTLRGRQLLQTAPTTAEKNISAAVGQIGKGR